MVDVEPSLRDPILYPNWVWLTGAVLILVAVLWFVGALIGYLKSAAPAKSDLKSLSAARRARYERLIAGVESDFEQGELTPREAHLAMAALIRAAATERSGYNVESLTVDEVALYRADWPELGNALGWCEEPSFQAVEASRHIADGARWARVVVG